MSAPDEKKYHDYLARVAIAAGHRQFGLVQPPKDPNDDEGGSGESGYQPPPGHPLLGAAAQFSGDYKPDTPLVNENPEGEKELKHRLEAQLDKKLQAERTFNPNPLRR